MTVSVKAPTSTTGSIQLNGSDVLTIDSSGNLTAPNNITANTIIPTSASAPTNGMFLPTTNTVGVSTNSTERMRIDSSGRVTMPYQPAFVANKTASATHSSATVSFQDAIVNVGSYYNTSTYRFTAPVAGTYYFYCIGLTNNTGDTGDLRFMKNSTDTNFTMYSNNLGTGYKRIVGSAILTLAVNDYVNINSVGSQNIYGATTNYHTTFGGYLIG